MLSSVLGSERAVRVNITVMRTFVKLRQLLATHAELAHRLDALEWRENAGWYSSVQRGGYTGVNLSGAFRIGTQFRGANLLRANFSGADLRSADVDERTMDSAIGDRNTRLPPGLKKPDNWLK